MVPTPDTEPLTRVLLVEDDERLASLTAEYLETHNLVVARESRGDRGLSEALRERFDCVLLDVMLPEYYKVRGWTDDGKVTDETRQRLSL